MYLQERLHRFNNAINERLERLFYIDGRDKPEHPQHHTYTGLHEKYRGLSSTRSEDVPA